MQTCHVPREILGILTKHGCNIATCHGGVKGQGGFKLSANALYPADDYQMDRQSGGYQELSPGWPDRCASVGRLSTSRVST